MKNIYEDENKNNSVEDISSGGFDFDEIDTKVSETQVFEPQHSPKPQQKQMPKGYPQVHPIKHKKAPAIKQQTISIPQPQPEERIIESEYEQPESQQQTTQPVYQQPQANVPPQAFQQPAQYAPTQPYVQQPQYFQGQPVQPYAQQQPYPQQQPVQYAPTQPYPQQPQYSQAQQPVQPYTQQQPYPPQQPHFQLTNEQIAILLSQYIAPIQYAQPTAPVQQPVQPMQQPSAPIKPEPPTNGELGTRVLFQSPDFDKPENSTDSFESEEIVTKKDNDSPFDDIDIDFSEETLPSRKTVIKPQPVNVAKNAGRVQMRTSAPHGDMSIDEVEIGSYELNAIAKKVPSSARPVMPTVKPVQNPNIVTAPNTIIPQQGTATREMPKSLSVEECESETYDDPTQELPEKKKKISTGELIRRIVLGVSVVAIVIAVGMLLNEYRLSRQNDNLQSEVSNLIISEATTKKQTTTKKPSKDDAKNTTAEKTTEAELTPEQQWAEIKSEYPNIVFPQNLQLKYAKLYATNQDFVGYLSADGGTLNLPIVQTDNDETYLEKNFYGQSTKYGCPFVTHFNNIDNLDMNTIIFGHHMNNGTVFGELDTYKDIEGFKKAPVITFNTLYKNYKWKIIAAFITNAEPEDDNGYVFQYYFTSLSTEQSYSAFLGELAQRSLYDTGVDVLPTDKILTLSTCSHEFTNARFVVVARMVRNGESAKIDTSLAVKNDNPRFPQAYYSAKRLENPYADASKWYVE